MGPQLYHLLTESAQRTPEAEAVAFEDQRLSYGELDRLSDRLAHALVDEGVEPGDRVGIEMPKSAGSLIAIHGVLKAGAVYVPLDPGAPPRRVADIVSNCGIRTIVAAGSEAAAVGAIARHAPLDTVAFIDTHDECALDGLPLRRIAWTDVLARTDTSPPSTAGAAHDLAYILYTSGSTGVPKGVMVSHANALAFVNWAATEFGVGSADRLSSHAPLHFDLSIFDIFAAMKTGASVALVPDGTSTFPIRLARWIEANRITLWYSVPSVLTLLLLRGRLDAVDLSRLRLVLFAGEVFPVRYLGPVMRALPHAAFANLYGPTETNVITCYRVPSAPVEDADPIPIGRPCSGADLLVINDAGETVVAAGDTGELCARGPTVARGYWGDGERTAQRFVDVGSIDGVTERMYRTGDVVMFDPDGNYRLVGRRDRMIKSRGYRIELDEIEIVLNAHPWIEEAAVVAVPDEMIGNRILGFVAPSKGAALAAGDVRDHCLQKLPRYMVPERFALLDRLPRTSTGKIDRVHLATCTAISGP
jgi:L-proline---[L-prolyl-carrier protein] ligase